MVLFNYSTKEITAKIVFYGPGLCGKTTNLQFVYDALPSNSKSKMLSLATKADRTLFFDFLPLDLGKIRGMRTRVQLYTVPGQVYYNSTRQLVLKGADGVVFVADSQDGLIDANIESWTNLKDNLKKQGVDVRKLPVVMQYNKRDLPGVTPVEIIDKQLNELNCPFFESVATSGIGVEDTLKGIVRLVLKDLMGRYGLSGDVGDDEIVLSPRPSGPVKVAGEPETLWAEDASKEMVEEVQDVPFLMSEAPGIQAPESGAASVEVVELGAGDGGGFVNASVEVMLDSETPAFPVHAPSAMDDGDDIVFDTLPEGISSPPPRPLAADSLVVALGGAPEKRAPQTPESMPMLPPEIPPMVRAAPAAGPSAVSAPPAVNISTPRPSDPKISPAIPPPAPRPSSTLAVPPVPRPSVTNAAQDPGTLLKEVTIPLNLSIDEVAGKRRIVVKIQLEVNILR